MPNPLEAVGAYSQGEAVGLCTLGAHRVRVDQIHPRLTLPRQSTMPVAWTMHDGTLLLVETHLAVLIVHATLGYLRVRIMVSVTVSITVRVIVRQVGVADKNIVVEMRLEDCLRRGGESKEKMHRSHRGAIGSG